LLSPAKYSNSRESGLQLTVGPGINQFDFQLETGEATR